MTSQSSPLSLADAGAESVSKIAYDSLEEAFPEVDPGLRPFGDKVLVQIRTPRTRTASGLILPDETRETEQWNTQVAKVIALGPVAFRNRDTLEPWPEGSWVYPGMYVRCPKYGGDRWQVRIPNSPDNALFVQFRDHDLSGEIPESKVLDTIAYIL